MKSERHTMILDLIEHNDVQTQEELADRLKQMGVSATQATVSRDIKELRLIKVLSDDGNYRYATVEKAEAGLKERFRRIFSDSVVTIASSVNIIVIKTLSGSANAAAEAIDSLRWNEIMGTIAGDNTIFMVIKDVKSVPDVMKRLGALARK